MTTTPTVMDPLDYNGLEVLPQRPRLPLVCSVHVHRNRDYPIRLLTEAVSCEGFTCISPVRFNAGETLFCEWTIGPNSDASLPGALVLKCEVEVLRSIFRADGDSGYTVDCRLLNYGPAPRRSATAAGVRH